MTNLKEVYKHLQDDRSRKIYISRSSFSLSDEKNYLTDIVQEMSVSKELLSWIGNKDRLVLFGGGTWGNAITYHLHNIKWMYVVDNKKAGQELNGYRISSVDEVEDICNCFVIIAVLFKYREVEDQLAEIGVPKENILTLARIVEQRQYFDIPGILLDEKEVFLDCGGFNGDTTEQFIKLVNGNYDHIYIFEPNKDLCKECVHRFRDVDNCTIVPKGTWSSNDKIGFIEEGEGSRFDGASDNEIDTVKIDSYLDGKRATFIKMDVEGAEYDSLIGAEKTIKKYRPKLAISVYHKRNDIWEIPMLLLGYHSDYRFYLRTYSFTGNDTVLYAL